MNYVLDASVILKWFLQEKDTEKSLEIKDNYVTGRVNLIEPDLLLYETTNTLRFQKGINEAETDKIIEYLFLFVDFVAPTSNMLKSANSIALKYNISVYDACYVVLAKEMNYEFITADEKLYNKLIHLPCVKLLSKL